MSNVPVPIDLQQFIDTNGGIYCSKSAIKTHYHTSYKTVLKWLDELGVELKVAPKFIPSKEELLECFSNNLYDKDITAQYNIGFNTLKKWYKYHNIENNPINRGRDIPSYEELYDIRINQGLTIPEIIQRYNSSFPTITKWLKVRGISTQRIFKKPTTYRPEYTEMYDLHIIQKKPFTEIANMWGVSDVTVSNIAKDLGIENKHYTVGSVSKQEVEVLDFIRQFFPTAGPIKLYDDLKINKKRYNTLYDICVHDKKIIIEYNGLSWHNERFIKDRKRHFNKTSLAHHHGYTIIQIYSDEWIYRKDIVKSIIKSKFNVNERIYARKLTIKEVSSKEANNFYEINHLQGRSNHYDVSYGLYNDVGKLMACMSFGKHHRKSDKSIVLKRYAGILNTNIVGGASKLFKHYIKLHNPIKIISWSDNRWSEGNLYHQLGFTLESELDPGYDYVYPNNIRKSAQSHTKSKIGCPKDTTEHDFLYERGVYRIWDCGKKRWVWNK